MKHKIYVDGQEGTTGLRIHEYLSARADIEVLRIDPTKRKDVNERRRLLNEADVAFLCLPDAAAIESVALVANPHTCIIDASTAHRINPDWAYGVPELSAVYRERIRTKKRIANPGCHATAFILPLKPLIDSKIIDSSATICSYSISGYTGGGKKRIEQYERGDDPKLKSPRPYAMNLHHKHLPEMRVHSGLQHAPVFSPIVGDFARGLACTILLPTKQLGITAQDLHQCLAEYYSDEHFVRVMPLNDMNNLDRDHFDVQATNDTNYIDVFVFASDHQALLVGRLDNLGKGASGAAIQSMNIHLGCIEATGL